MSRRGVVRLRQTMRHHAAVGKAARRPERDSSQQPSDREPDPQDTPRVANPLDVARFTFLSFFAALAPGACGSWRCT